MSYSLIREIKIELDFGNSKHKVGRLAIRDSVIYFEYDTDFIQTNIEISPYRLPLKTGLQRFEYNPFEGLQGVFNDSLPDGWGRLLFDRAMRAKGILPQELSPLDRLAHVGNNAIGALIYQPDNSISTSNNDFDLDSLANDAEAILKGTSDDMIGELLARNGSSQGARPKAMIGVDLNKKNIISDTLVLPNEFEHWIVKFPSSSDGNDAGAIEYIYSLMAKQAGLEIMQTHLFSSKQYAGFFATKRFDRNEGKRFHAHTACGILHSDFRTPSLDYSDLINLTRSLTRDIREVEKMFRICVFNVLAYNRDDHSKNISYLMNESGEWKLAPAYDLTFSSGPNGEQSTSVLGEGKNPSLQHLVRLGKDANLNGNLVANIIEQTKEALSNWPKLVEAFGISRANIVLINERIDIS